MYYTRFFEEDLIQQQFQDFIFPGASSSLPIWGIPGTKIIPFVVPSGEGGGVPIPGGQSGMTDNELLALAIFDTGKAVGQGLVIASIDGPIPVMDIVGFLWASYKTIEAWENYRLQTQ